MSTNRNSVARAIASVDLACTAADSSSCPSAAVAVYHHASARRVAGSGFRSTGVRRPMAGTRAWRLSCTVRLV
ncbi:hypothetical protein OG206_30465 [Streptomyces sp. NBC_01341]|uniref:hypothetical protein n=1 Tax=Streptomyces sp. NBC_01341 TaxID=2903831 RepID=UPI002E162A5A|nr:hypothetical protein OG206_30465 [Streptomyces sp. NBC_01341]